MHPPIIPSPKTGCELVDEYFIENRTRVLELAAFLDRLDRAALGDAAGASSGDAARDAGRDFRVRLFREALGVLAERGAADGAAPRVERIQLLFSDPTTEPLARLDQKSARGAYDRWHDTHLQSEGV